MNHAFLTNRENLKLIRHKKKRKAHHTTIVIRGGKGEFSKLKNQMCVKNIADKIRSSFAGKYWNYRTKEWVSQI